MQVKRVSQINSVNDYCFFDIFGKDYIAYKLDEKSHISFTKRSRVVNGSNLSRRLYKNKILLDLGQYLIIKEIR
jgi:hypothetical protein